VHNVRRVEHGLGRHFGHARDGVNHESIGTADDERARVGALLSVVGNGPGAPAVSG